MVAESRSTYNFEYARNPGDEDMEKIELLYRMKGIETIVQDYEYIDRSNAGNEQRKRLYEAEIVRSW